MIRSAGQSETFSRWSTVEPSVSVAVQSLRHSPADQARSIPLIPPAFLLSSFIPLVQGPWRSTQSPRLATRVSVANAFHEPSTRHMEQVIARLRAWLEDSIQALSEGTDKGAALTRKLDLERAIACLELCELHRVDPRGKVVLLPDPETSTPSSEFRVIEDHESDEPQHWVEILVDGEPVRPSPGDAIFSTIRQDPPA